MLLGREEKSILKRNAHLIFAPNIKPNHSMSFQTDEKKTIVYNEEKLQEKMRWQMHKVKIHMFEIFSSSYFQIEMKHIWKTKNNEKQNRTQCGVNCENTTLF